MCASSASECPVCGIVSAVVELPDDLHEAAPQWKEQLAQLYYAAIPLSYPRSVMTKWLAQDFPIGMSKIWLAEGLLYCQHTADAPANEVCE